MTVLTFLLTTANSGHAETYSPPDRTWYPNYSGCFVMYSYSVTTCLLIELPLTIFHGSKTNSPIALIFTLFHSSSTALMEGLTDVQKVSNTAKRMLKFPCIPTDPSASGPGQTQML
jgi:hypothetical protein